jgi:hypothetical protein
MTISRFALVGLLALAASAPVHANSAFESEQTCKMPALPPSQATKLDWQLYGSNMKTYQDCMSAKAEKVGKTTKKALETVGEGATKTKEGIEKVGEKVIGWKETASGWFSKE